MKYREIHSIALRFCKVYRPFSKAIGGMSEIMRNDCIELFALKNDIPDSVSDLQGIISEMIKEKK